MTVTIEVGIFRMPVSVLKIEEAAVYITPVL
jgi:hypothetical protein